MISFLKNLFKKRTILDELSIVLVDKVGCGWYNLHSKDGTIYEFNFDEDGYVHIYYNRCVVFYNDDINDTVTLYLLVQSHPRIIK